MAQIGQISLLFIMNNVLPPRPSMGTIPKYIFNELKLVVSSDIASDALTAAAVCFQLSTVIALSYSSKAIQIPVYVNSIQFRSGKKMSIQFRIHIWKTSKTEINTAACSWFQLLAVMSCNQFIMVIMLIMLIMLIMVIVVLMLIMVFIVIRVITVIMVFKRYPHMPQSRICKVCSWSLQKP